jgi:isocitrate dehydrogenase (NAD+)
VEFVFVFGVLSGLDVGVVLILVDFFVFLDLYVSFVFGSISSLVGLVFFLFFVSVCLVFVLFVYVRVVMSMAGSRSCFQDVDIITVRENLEGLYSGVGHIREPDRAELRSIITRDGSTRVLGYAFDMARRLGRRRVTVVHKANIMKSTSGLFLEVARDVSKGYPEVAMEEMIVDNCAMQLVMNPERFDVIVTTNLFGDILSDLCAGLVGGLGLAPGANIGKHKGIFEAVHGSAPDIAGKGIANPTALMLAAALMLDYLGAQAPAERIRKAITQVIGKGDHLTRDLGGSATTDEYLQGLLAVV